MVSGRFGVGVRWAWWLGGLGAWSKMSLGLVLGCLGFWVSWASDGAQYRGYMAMLAQNFGRIQKVDPPILDSSIPMV